MRVVPDLSIARLDRTPGCRVHRHRPAADAERAAGRRSIIFPTLLNLRKLGRAASVAEAFEAARGEPIVTVLPRVEMRGETRTMVLPADAGYEVVEAPLSEVS